MTSPETYCRQIVQRAGSNFALAFGLLPRPQRRAMRAVYAFARVVDDIVDGELARADQDAHLAMWRGEVARIGRQGSDHPLTLELIWAQHNWHINPKYLRELIDGVAVDLEPVHITDAAALRRYCYGVAGTVGLLCLPIFGVGEDARTRAGALALANAFQITNMLRDLRADAQLGRVYLPADDLAYFGIRPDDLQQPITSASRRERFRELVCYEIARAETCYIQAWATFTDAEQRLMKPALVMSASYRQLLRKIRHDPQRVLRERVRLSMREKMMILARALVV